MEPFPLIDRINDGTLCNKRVDGLNVDPITYRQNEINEENRLHKTENSAENSIDIAEERNLIYQSGADFSEQPAANLDDKKENHKRNNDTQPVCNRLSDAARNRSRQTKCTFQSVFKGVAEGKSYKDGKDRTRQLANSLDKSAPTSQ